MNTRIIGLILISALLVISPTAGGASAAPMSEPTFGGTFTVNSGLDIDFYDSVLTLREAIEVSNGTLFTDLSDGEKAQLGGCTFVGSPGSWTITGGCGSGIADTIVFSGTLNTITLNSSPLPELTDANTLISGVGGWPMINALEESSGSVFKINGNNIGIQALSIYNTPPDDADIWIVGGKGAYIENNHLGMTPTGVCGDNSRNGSNGVKVTTPDGAVGSGNGAAYIFHNTIGCHSKDGVLVKGADYTRIGLNPALIMNGNYIGIDASDSSLPNGLNGIRVEPNAADQASDNVIIANTIGNNGNSGVLIDQTSSTNVLSNTIGANRYGLIAAPNSYDGVRITGASSILNIIQFNTISANLQSGVLINAGDNNYVMDNRIGINSPGNARLPNGQDGVALYNNANQNYIGVETSLAQPQNIITHIQRIAGNTYAGIYINNSDQNYIGELNLIYENGNGGVVVADAGSTGNRITPLGVINNGGLPIDLGEDGQTLNDAGDLDSGANTLLNFPVITSSTETLLVGTSCSGCYVFFYMAYRNPGSKGGGGELLGHVTAVGTDWIVDLSTFPNGSGLTAKDVSLVAVQPGLESNTSEMSPRALMFLPLTIKP